jgi:FAD/FMN-containing dehydrogenase/Fe-S oxidoreductase
MPFQQKRATSPDAISFPFNLLLREIDGELTNDPIHRTLFATDGSIFQVLPQAVVHPKSWQDVQKTVLFAKANNITIHPRGAGSGLCGSALGPGIVIDFARFMNRLIAIDPETQTFTCEPGYRLGELERDLTGSGLFFPPDPSSGEYATFGGMFGTNASGAHSVKYGNVADYLVDADIVSADGSIIRLSEIQDREIGDLPPNLQKLADLYTENAHRIEAAYPETRFNTTGYNLRGLVRDNRLILHRLFTGAEGTLGIAVRLTFRLIEKPSNDSLVVAYMDDIVSSARLVQQVLPMGPSGIEIMDKTLLRLAAKEDPSLEQALPKDVDNVLLIEFDGFSEAAVSQNADAAVRLIREKGLSNRVHVAVRASEKKRFWAVRKAAVPILYRLKGKKKILALIEDAAVPIDRLVDYFEGVYALLNRNQVGFVVYGHIAKGLLHTRPLLDLQDPSDVDLLKSLADEFYQLISSFGGAVSGEHGDGRLRSAYIRKSYPDIYPLFIETKKLLDADECFNPDIITRHDPDQMKKELRYGPSYKCRSLGEEELRWRGGFADAIEMCHGCAKCTTVTAATRMCPVYKSTREEAASPRAKANLLRSILGGDLKKRDIWEKAIQSVTDLCILCENCKRECPSNVDIPKLIWEARYRYVEKFGASLHSRMVTQPEAAGRGLNRVSKWVNPIVSLPIVKSLGQQVAGVSAKRPAISIAPQSLFRWDLGRPKAGGKPVLYFSGCYAGYIKPEIGRAAMRLLTLAGYSVHVPAQHCCGLPMMSKGMAQQARRKITQNLRLWGNLITSAEALVVTCSSCGLALLEAWGDIVGGPAAARIRKKVIHISRLIAPFVSAWSPQNFKDTVFYHLPCHLKCQPQAGSSLDLLKSIQGLTVKTKESGCCGMAGTWGLHRDHEPLSRSIGSGLMKAFEGSGATLGVTDCPTCRMQMEYLGTRPVRHPIEILADQVIGVY